MKKIIEINLCFLTIIVLFISSTKIACADNYITIKFDRLELLKKGWQGQQFYFKINGKVILPDDKAHRIKINSNALDCLVFAFDSTFQNSEISYTKFKSRQTYKILINPCSQFELVADQNANMGQIKFEAINNIDTTFAYLNSELRDTLMGNVTKDYFEIEASAMCYFAPKTFYFKDNFGKEENTNNVFSIDEKLSFCFLHGEKLTVTYDGATRKIKMTVDGYIR